MFRIKLNIILISTANIVELLNENSTNENDLFVYITH